MYRAFCRTARPCSLALPSLTSLRLNHKHHATITKSSSKSSPILYPNFKCHKKSTNFGKLAPRTSKGIPRSFQISYAFSQSHGTCSLLSTPKPHASQVGLSITFWWHKLAFVGTVFLLAHHAKDLTFFGTLSLHMVFQNNLFF